ncbi:MAG TPA: response regulator [Gammaproteobacteria bacterium]|nr:response regulator [Gammaproteobacteria bacterium]
MAVKKIKVLIVEDDELNSDMLSQRLKRKGYDIILAVNGEEAIQIAKKKLPHIILMDMGLPILDGWEASRQLKADAATKHIPIIALTGHTTATDRERSIEVGCEEYESKPVDFVSLIEKIEKLVK